MWSQLTVWTASGLKITSFIIDQAYGTKDTFVEFISVHLLPSRMSTGSYAVFGQVSKRTRYRCGLDAETVLNVGGKWCGREAGESAVNTWCVRSAGSSERAREVKSCEFVKKKKTHHLYIFNVQPSQYPYNTSSCEKLSYLNQTIQNHS